MPEQTPPNEGEILLYSTPGGHVRVEVFFKDETFWLTQLRMAELFGSSKQAISYHLRNIFETKELDRAATVKEILTVQSEGLRNVQRNIEFYNLDSIISVGYRVNSQKATLFRIWATTILKEYLTKGFALDDDRLKQGKNLFGKDYFDELLEKIREIRASERRFYQKITDLYMTASDYDKNAQITHTFFATVQNKLEYAITKHTASELVKLRTNSKVPNMGLTSWKNEKKGGKILKSDVSVGKNYLTEPEISELNRIVSMYLDYAENQASRGKLIPMKEWVEKLDAFLKFNDYNLLTDSGKIRADVAKRFAEKEYDKFRIVQDDEFKSDFDKIAEKIRLTGSLPKETRNEIENSNLSDFNQKIKKGLDFNPKEKG